MKSTLSFWIFAASLGFSYLLAVKNKNRFSPLKNFLNGKSFGIFSPAFEGDYADMKFQISMRKADFLVSGYTLRFECFRPFKLPLKIYKNKTLNKMSAKIDPAYVFLKTGNSDYDENFILGLQDEKQLKKAREYFAHIKNLIDMGFDKLYFSTEKVEMDVSGNDIDALLSPNFIMPVLDAIKRIP